jgi:hypothetical protein
MGEMKYGLRKGLEDIAGELKGIRTVLNSIWHSHYKNDESLALNPEAYADEYISTEECAKRLNISDQTIRNWIAIGRNKGDKGWKEGVHYVNVAADSGKKAIIRIPWNALVQSFAKNRKTQEQDFWKHSGLYRSSTPGKLENDT